MSSCRATNAKESTRPCAKCGKPRTKAEGADVFTTCEGPGYNCDGTPETATSHRHPPRHRRPAKVWTWKGWGIKKGAILSMLTHTRSLAAGHAAMTGWPLVRVEAKCKEVRRR